MIWSDKKWVPSMVYGKYFALLPDLDALIILIIKVFSLDFKVERVSASWREIIPQEGGLIAKAYCNLSVT